MRILLLTFGNWLLVSSAAAAVLLKGNIQEIFVQNRTFFGLTLIISCFLVSVSNLRHWKCTLPSIFVPFCSPHNSHHLKPPSPQPTVQYSISISFSHPKERDPVMNSHMESSEFCWHRHLQRKIIFRLSILQPRMDRCPSLGECRRDCRRWKWSYHMADSLQSKTNTLLPFWKGGMPYTIILCTINIPLHIFLLSRKHTLMNVYVVDENTHTPYSHTFFLTQVFGPLFYVVLSNLCTSTTPLFSVRKGNVGHFPY